MAAPARPARPAPPFVAMLLVLLLALLGGTAARNYSLPELDEAYASDPRVVDRGLAPVYQGVALFLRGIQHGELLPPDLLRVENGLLKLNDDVDPGSVAVFYAGVLAVLCVGLVVAAVAPCVGLAWCFCCRGGGKRRRLHDHEEDDLDPDCRQPSAPWLAPLFLSAATCVIFVGVAVALAASSYVDDGLLGVGHHIKSGTADLRLFMDNAKTEVDTYLGVNYNELSSELNSILKDASQETDSIVKGFINSLPEETLKNMASGIDNVRSDLEAIQLEIKTCMSTSAQIVDEINSTKSDLEQICSSLTSCPSQLRQLIQDMTLPTFETLPDSDIDKSIADMTSTIPVGFSEKLQAGWRKVNDVGNKVEEAVKDVSINMNQKIDETGNSIREKASELTQTVNNASDALSKVDEAVSTLIEKPYNEYSVYRTISFGVFCGVILIIAALITAGLVCGTCSSKHSYEFLNIPVALILLTMSVWILIVSVLFVTGFAMDRGCEFLHNPGDYQVSHLVDELFSYRNGTNDSSQLPPWQNISYYFGECRDNKAMYEVLGLESTLQIDNIVKSVDDFDFADFEKKVNMFMDEVTQIPLIPEDLTNTIKDLKESSISQLDVNGFEQQVKLFQQQTLSLSAETKKWAQQLKDLGTKIDVTDLESRMNETTANVYVLLSATDDVATLLHNLDKHMKLGKDSFPDALQWLLDQANLTDDLVAASANQIKERVILLAEEFRKEVRVYLQYAVDRVKTDALKCSPIMNIYDTIVMGVCDEIVSPMNAFWAMCGLCLILFIPIGFAAGSLASRRS